MRADCDGRTTLLPGALEELIYVYTHFLPCLGLIPLPLWLPCSGPVMTINDKDRLHTIQLQMYSVKNRQRTVTQTIKTVSGEGVHVTPSLFISLLLVCPGNNYI